MVTGPTKLGGFLVFSWLGFWGLYLAFRAFRIAFPDDDYRRYAPPRLLPAVARLLAVEPRQGGVDDVHDRHRPLRRRGSWSARPAATPCSPSGSSARPWSRPHITLLLFVSLFASFLLRRTEGEPSPFGALGELLGFLVLLGVGTVVARPGGRLLQPRRRRLAVGRVGARAHRGQSTTRRLRVHGRSPRLTRGGAGGPPSACCSGRSCGRPATPRRSRRPRRAVIA